MSTCHHVPPGAWMYLFASLLGAQSAAAQAPQPPAPDNPYLAILDAARAAPAEVFADITFRLLDKLAQKQKAAALEEVFRRAGEAREPLPLRYALPGRASGPAEPVERARNLRLDALTLRCRVVLELLKSDPRLARALFEEIAFPAVPRPECRSEFVPDAGIYIRTLAAVAERGAFTREEREKQAPWFLVERGARGVSSSWEVVAAAAEFPRFARNEKEAGILTAALAASLALADSDRAFTSAMRSGGLVKGVLDAGGKLSAGGANAAILESLRRYLVRHLSATRCEDFIGPQHLEALAASLPMIDGFDAFNDAVQGRTDIPPISADECKPATLAGRAVRAEYANDAGYQALLKEIAGLMAVPRGQSLWRIRLTAEWGFRARQTLSRIEEWTGAHGQDPLEVFHQKCRLISRMADMMASGEPYRIAVNELVALMEDPLVLARSPAEWLLEVEWFQAMQQVFTPERVKIMRELLAPKEELAASFTYETGLEIPQALAASRLPALSLYGRLGLLKAGQGPKAP